MHFESFTQGLKKKNKNKNENNKIIKMLFDLLTHWDSLC